MTNKLTTFGGEGQPLTMSSREIAELTGKEHKNVIRDIRAMLDELSAHGSDLSHVREEKDARGYTACFHLDRNLTDTLLTGYSATLRYAVVKRWAELEAERQAPSPFAIPTNLVDALRLAADQMERAERAERTKAEIGSRREATAMATASAAVRKAKALEIELDISSDFATVKRMEIIYSRRFPWAALKRVSAAHNLEIRKVPDANYDEVNSYHAKAWGIAYGVVIPREGSQAA